jgi:hypothetical protein
VVGEPLERAVASGRRRALEIVERSRRRRAGTRALPFQGYLVAEGDSWFDYPFFEDVLEALEDEHGFTVRSVAHHGETAAGMAYEAGQLRKLHAAIRDLAGEGHTARALLVSCGGNDVVDALASLLNHGASGLERVNRSVLEGVLRQQIPAAIASLVGSVHAFSEQYFGGRRPVLLHGYAAPVPDGRGYPLLGLAGPWLKPVFARRGHVTSDPQHDEELESNRDVMAELMRVYNEEVLPAVVEASGPAVFQVDVRAALTNELAGRRYEESWRDEMHATARGFKAVASVFARRIAEVAPLA